MRSASCQGRVQRISRFGDRIEVVLDQGASVLGRRLGEQILKLGAGQLVFAKLELRARQLEACAGEAWFGEHDTAEREYRFVRLAAIERRHAEQVIKEGRPPNSTSWVASSAYASADFCSFSSASA